MLDATEGQGDCVWKATTPTDDNADGDVSNDAELDIQHPLVAVVSSASSRNALLQHLAADLLFRGMTRVRAQFDNTAARTMPHYRVLGITTCVMTRRAVQFRRYRY